MRLTMLLGKTLRQPPSDADLPSHRLLTRAAYVRALEPGWFAYLPLGHRALRRLQMLVREELVRLGGQQVHVPPLSETESAQALVQMVRREVDSYRQLPVLLFQTAAQAVAQSRVRAGLFGAGERPQIEICAFDDQNMTATAQDVESALARILRACDVPAVWAEAGEEGRRAYFVHPVGDEELVQCAACGYAAERSWAATAWVEPQHEDELEPEEVETPGCNTIAALAEFLDIPTSQTLKMVFYSVEGSVTCIVIRGDRAVDERKLARVLGTDQYYASLEDELATIGAVGGYASPIGLDTSRVRVVADPSARAGRNFVSGANRPDYHIRNVNIPRDFSPGEWVDMAQIVRGDPCAQCGAPLQVDSVFGLACCTAPVPCSPVVEYLDAEGRAHPLSMASWRLDLGRLQAAVVEVHHDDHGILWPLACTPFEVHLLALDLRREEVAAQAVALYNRLQASGLAVLFDDRSASAGVKFNDADLIGIPLRLTVSKRSAKEGLVEAKWRHSSERLKLDDEALEVELARLR